MTIPMDGWQHASGTESEPQGEDLTESSTPILVEPVYGDRPAATLPDSVRLWLREIGQFPRLSREQEQALAQRIEQGDHGDIYRQPWPDAWLWRKRDSTRHLFTTGPASRPDYFSRTFGNAT